MADDKIKYLDDAGLARVAEDLEYRHPSTFTGTQMEWLALPSERKQLYKIVNFTDDDADFIGIRHPNIFTGTRAEWASVPIDEKVKYLLVCLTDDLAGIGWYLSNQVAEGDMNPVTSNAVYEALSDKSSIFVTDGILLDFNGGLTATYTDERITANTNITVYYANPTLAEAAEIASNSIAGGVVFTALTPPTAKVACKIFCVN